MIYGKLVKFCHILVAIVGIVAAIAPFLITTIYNQIYSKPNVILDIIPNIEGNGQRTRFDIRNIGVVPATNLSLLIDSPKKIMTVTNIFSTSHLSLPDFNNTILHSNIPMTINERFLEIKAAKLVHGGGSDILIETLIDSKTNQSYEDYRASLIYDQGSTVGKKQKEITNQYTPQEILASWWDRYPLLTMLYFGALVGVPVYYLLFLTKKLRLRFLTGVVREMINIRRDLSDDPNTTKILHNQWKYYSPWGTPKPLSNWYLKRNKRFITHVDDYLRIDDFYSKLEERNKRLNDQTPYTQIEIEQKNRECLDLVNKALKEIDWKKYK